MDENGGRDKMIRWIDEDSGMKTERIEKDDNWR